MKYVQIEAYAYPLGGIKSLSVGVRGEWVCFILEMGADEKVIELISLEEIGETPRDSFYEDVLSHLIRSLYLERDCIITEYNIKRWATQLYKEERIYVW